MIGPLLFKPIYQERVWGGRNLEQALNRELPAEKVIGESWEIVDRPEAQSVVARGPLAGSTLREVIEKCGLEVMGASWNTSRPFPILVKWLDCQERLSLQVHPPAAVAEELKGEPKTENWYVADASDNASLIVGLRQGVTRNEFEKALADGRLESCVHRFPVKPGDSILVESGRLHAIDAGNLILEIQQNSDTTYRVYDWGRVGLDGKPRQLHVKQSMRSIDFNDFEPAPMRAAEGDVVLAECPEFRIQKWNRKAGEAFPSLNNLGAARLLHVADGEVEIAGEGETGRFVAGDNVLLPACEIYEINAATDATVLLTDRFSA
jgi:mannose-6-phosphate isomerase